MFISEAFAQAGDAAAAQGSVYGTLIQLGLIFVIFYVLLIRPVSYTHLTLPTKLEV